MPMERWRQNLYSLWAAQLIAALGLNLVIPFFPFYLRELGLKGTEAVKIWSGLVFAAPFMISAFLQPIWGVFGDRFGRKPMIIRAMLGLALANFLMAFAKSASQFLMLRLFQGFLSGFVAPALALISTCAPKEKTGQALGTLQSSLVTGFVIGPLLGGVLSHFMGYRFIFFGTALFCSIGSMIVFHFVKEDSVGDRGKKDTALWKNLRFVFHSAELIFLLILMILVQLSIVLVAPFLSLYIEFLKFPARYVGLMTGIVFGITGITNACAAPFWGQYADRVGYRRVLRYSLIGVTLFSLPQAFVFNVYQLLVLRAGLGIFVSGVVPSINTVIQRSTAEKDRGVIYGIFQGALLVGNMSGPLAGGFLAAFLGLRSVFLITALSFLFAAIWEKRNSPRN